MPYKIIRDPSLGLITEAFSEQGRVRIRVYRNNDQNRTVSHIEYPRQCQDNYELPSLLRKIMDEDEINLRKKLKGGV